MDLEEFPVIQVEGRNLIRFNNPALVTLESLLNGDIRTERSFTRYLTKLRNLKNGWSNLDSIVQEHYGGYWKPITLEAFNVIGEWFTFGGSEDINIYINKANQHIYIENKMIEYEPVVEMQLDEFINILEQWRIIQNKDNK